MGYWWVIKLGWQRIFLTDLTDGLLVGEKIIMRLKTMTKTVLTNVKVKDIPELIAQLKLSPETTVNLSIEQTENDLMGIMDKIGQAAEARGLTEEKLAELLEDES